jgi:hypothetical protein
MIRAVKIHLVDNPHYAKTLAHLSWTILNSPATAQLVLHYYNTKYTDCNTVAIAIMKQHCCNQIQGLLAVCRNKRPFQAKI